MPRSSKSDSDEVTSELRRLDGIIPEGLDRRNFLKVSAASTFGLLAGCSGDSGTPTEGDPSTEPPGTPTGGSTPSDETIVRNVIWRQPFAREPAYVPAYTADLRGTFQEHGVSAPSVQRGFGSADTAQRVGTGEEALGHGDLVPQVTGLSSGLDLKIIGTSKAINVMSFIYRADMVSDPTDLSGLTVNTGQPLSQAMFDLYLEGIDQDPSQVEERQVEHSTQVALLEQGDIAGLFDPLDELPALRGQLEESDVELEASPIYQYYPVVGYTLIANNSWLGEDGNTEYAARALSGWSEAAKWSILNPEDAIDLLVEDINQALQTQSREDLLNGLRISIGTVNYLDGIKENGMGWIDMEAMESSLDGLGSTMEEADPDQVPAAEEAVATEVQSSAELASFTDDEWSQVEEFVGEWTTYFE